MIPLCVSLSFPFIVNANSQYPDPVTYTASETLSFVPSISTIQRSPTASVKSNTSGSFSSSAHYQFDGAQPGRAHVDYVVSRTPYNTPVASNLHLQYVGVANCVFSLRKEGNLVFGTTSSLEIVDVFFYYSEPSAPSGRGDLSYSVRCAVFDGQYYAVYPNSSTWSYASDPSVTLVVSEYDHVLGDSTASGSLTSSTSSVIDFTSANREFSFPIQPDFPTDQDSVILPDGRYRYTLECSFEAPNTFSVSNALSKEVYLPASYNSSAGVFTGFLTVFGNGTGSLSLTCTDAEVATDTNFFTYLSGVCVVDVPVGTALTINTSIGKNFVCYSFAVPNALQVTSDRILSAGGQNDVLNNQNQQVEDTFNQYEQVTDTEEYYNKIDTNLLNFDISIFTQIAATSTLFSSLITMMWSAMGNLAVPLTLFLVAALASLVVGIFRNAGD